MATTVTITTIAMATITAMTATLRCEAMLTVNPMDHMDIAMDKATIITCISWAGAMTKAMPPTWPR